MGQSGKDSAEKREAPEKAFGELMDLFLKLNSKLREKIFPRSKEEKGKTEKTEMVIIIINNRSSENPVRPPHPEKSKPPKPGWINRLCEEIEREGGKEKSS
jgi:hypothetical protein